jgi:chromosome segregation ATPase
MHLHAVMTKTHDTLVKDSNQQKVEIKRLRDKESRLYETIHSLEKDIQSHKKEIREREETITDKEKRIFELKKKNQVILFLLYQSRVDVKSIRSFNGPFVLFFAVIVGVGKVSLCAGLQD